MRSHASLPSMEQDSGQNQDEQRRETTGVSGRGHPFHQRFDEGSLFRSEVCARQEIEAPITDVWLALIDFPSYPVWNPFTPRVSTDLEIGSPVQLHVVMPGRSASDRTEWLNLVEPEKTICWGMHMGAPWLLTANRWQCLTPLSDTRTEYVTTDKFSGLLAPLVMALYAKPIETGFQQVADGLKAYVENRKENNT